MIAYLRSTAGDPRPRGLSGTSGQGWRVRHRGRAQHGRSSHV